MFPIIETINDIPEGLINERNEFSIRKRPGYTVIDYDYAGPTTFDLELLRECRGIKFDSAGKIMARPYHKFFNIGERGEAIRPQSSHTVWEKLDGSMIHPSLIYGNLVLMTRAGITDVSQKATQHLTGQQKKWLTSKKLSGYTPILEYCSPDNRIVLPYNYPTLYLTGVRHDISGAYADLHSDIDSPFTLCPSFSGAISDPSAFLDIVKRSSGIEGYVIKYSSGHMQKVKCDEYLTKHRAKDALNHTKDIVAMILEDKIDDFIPLLDNVQRPHVESLQVLFLQKLPKCELLIKKYVEVNSDLSRKDFAVGIQKMLPQPLWSVTFTWIDHPEQPLKEILIDKLLTYCRTEAKVNELIEFIKGI